MPETYAFARLERSSYIEISKMQTEKTINRKYIVHEVTQAAKGQDEEVKLP